MKPTPYLRPVEGESEVSLYGGVTPDGKTPDNLPTGPTNLRPVRDPIEDLGNLLSIANKEVARRLRDRELRTKIPHSVLFNFATTATKILAAAQDDHPSEAARLATQHNHILAVLSEQGLPLGRQADLISQMIAEVGDERARELGLTATLEILVGRDEAGRRLAIEQET